MKSLYNSIIRIAGIVAITGLVSVATAASTPNTVNSAGGQPASTTGKTVPASAEQQVQARNALRKLPMHFEAHTGAAGGPTYSARGRGYHLSLQAGELQLRLKKPTVVPTDPEARRAWVRSQVKDGRQRKLDRSKDGYSAVLRKTFPGANANPQVAGEDLLPGKSHYMVGKDPTKWRRNISNYAKVRYRNVYRGIDLVYYGNAGRIEYDWIVAPGADPHRIVESFNGATSVNVADNGDLLIISADGPLVQKKPVIFQEVAGQRVAVEGAYVLLGANKVGFKVGKYDPSLPLIIDPVVEYSTYLGGSLADEATSVAVNAAGEVFVSGITQSPDFPHAQATGSFPTDPFGYPQGQIGFVTKLNAAGDAIVYSTYFGGTGYQYGSSIALGADGSAYVAGIASSSDFPATVFLQSPGQPPSGTREGAFVVKLTPNGSAMSYSTIIARQGYDTRALSVSVAVDANGSAYVAGATTGLLYPTTAGALQPGKIVESRYEGFVAKLTPGGNALTYSTLFGGLDANDTAGDTFIKGVAIDASGGVYITGETRAASIPMVSAFQSVYTGSFYARINPSGSALDYSSFFDYNSNAITVDRQGNAIIASNVVSKINPSGAVVFTVGLSGGTANAVATDRLGNIYVTGGIDVYNYDAIGNTGLGGNPNLDMIDAFVSKIAADGSAFGFSLRLGGDAVADGPSQFNYSDFSGGWDKGNGIAVDANGGIYIVGITRSPNFPILNAFQSTPEGQVLDPNAVVGNSYIYGEAFLTKLSEPIGGIGLFSNKNPSFTGDAVTFSAIIGDSAATGTVTFFDGATALSTVPVTAGVARFTTATLAIAAHTITARYNGDATHPVATSAPLDQDVLDPNAQPANTVTTITAIPNPNGSITLNATVSGANPKGIVTLYDNGTRHIGNLVSGAASITIANPLPGQHTVTARYAGDVRNLPSDSPVLMFRLGPPEVVITQPLDGATLQYPTTVQFTVDAISSLGTTIASVALSVNGAPLATLTTPPYTVPLANGPPGTYTLSARATDSFGRTSPLVSVQIRIYELGTTFYHHDLQGNVIAASDGLGQVNYTESSLPYGSRQVNSPASAVAQTNGNRLWFHGKAQDEATGLQYFGARYYDPALGRFMGVDPAGFDESNIHSFNRFAYGNNNPYKFRDPDGRTPVHLAIGIIALAYMAYEMHPISMPKVPFDSGAAISTVGPGDVLGAAASAMRLAGAVEAGGSAVARAAASARADVAQAAGRTNGAAAATVTRDGTVFTDVSAGAATRVNHPTVQAALDRVPASQRAGARHGQCAEIGCFNQILEAGKNVSGSATAAAKIRKPGSSAHGTSIEPCSSCRAVGKDLGTTF